MGQGVGDEVKQGVGDEVKQGVGEEVRSEDLQYYYVYVYIYVTLYQINYITLELALHTEKDMHLRHLMWHF